MHYKQYNKQLLKYIENIEKTDEGHFSRISDEIFSDNQHNMFVGKEKLLKVVFDDFSDLEKADLTDFFAMENNGRNKKR